MERNGATRREVVRGMAMVTAGVCLRPMVAFGSTPPQDKGTLPRTAPHEVGVDPAAVMAFVDAVN